MKAAERRGHGRFPSGAMEGGAYPAQVNGEGVGLADGDGDAEGVEELVGLFPGRVGMTADVRDTHVVSIRAAATRAAERPLFEFRIKTSSLGGNGRRGTRTLDLLDVNYALASRGHSKYDT